MARQMLSSGVVFGLLQSRIRDLFVQVAERDLALPGREATDSRISVLTGINRKEVRRIRREREPDSGPAPFSRNLAADLVSRWLTDSDTVDGRGRALALPYRAKNGPSFVKLVHRTTADVRPRSILDELTRTGVVEIQEDKTIGLLSDAYLPRREPERLAMLLEDPAELINTMLHNIFSTDASQLLLQQKVAYDNLGTLGIEEVRRHLRREAERFLQRIDVYLASQDRDRNPGVPGGERQSVGIGVYYFEPAPKKRRERAERRARSRK